MSEQITAEILTEEPPTTTDVPEAQPTAPVEEPTLPTSEPEPAASPTPAADPEPEAEPSAPEGDEEPEAFLASAPLPPEVSATVMQSPSGVWGVQIYTQHPDQLDVAVNGRAVWRGIA